MNRLACSFVCAAVAFAAPVHALANCLDLPPEALVRGKLYARPLHKTNPNAGWVDVAAVPSSAEALRGRALRLVHVVDTDTQGGVVAIRQRSEVAGKGQDTQVIHIERPAVREACLPGKQRPLDEHVSATSYKDYHDDLGRKHSDLLYRFHFRYKPANAADCRRTDDATIEGRTHFRYDIPVNVGPATLRAANVGEATAPEFFRIFLSAVGQVFGTQANALTHPASAPTLLQGERHYVYLRTMLRRYPASRVGEASCVSFNIDARDDIQATTLSITDLSDPDRVSTLKTNTWSIIWPSSDGR